MEEKPPLEEEAASAASTDEPNASVFPLFPLTDSSLQTKSSVPQWLCNSSFTADISLINDAVASQINEESHPEEELDEEEVRIHTRVESKSYEILESSESDRETGKNKRKKKKKRKRDGSREKAGLDDYESRKSRVRAWADSDSNISKDYYFDSHGDHDNLAFGCIYRYRFIKN